MKKALLAAAVAAIVFFVALWFFLATSAGTGIAFRSILDRLNTPVEVGSIHTTSFGRFDTQSLRAAFKEVEVTSESNRHVIWFQTHPPALHFDSKLSDVRLRLTRPALNGRSILFSEGKILTQIEPGGVSRITLVDWISPEVEFGGVATLDKGGSPIRVHVGGSADIALLAAVFLKKDVDPKWLGRIPFELKYEAGFFEAIVNGKPWLRSRWTMRR